VTGEQQLREHFEAGTLQFADKQAVGILASKRPQRLELIDLAAHHPLQAGQMQSIVVRLADSQRIAQFQAAQEHPPQKLAVAFPRRSHDEESALAGLRVVAQQTQQSENRGESLQ
jgi:hypothetical protein